VTEWGPDHRLCAAHLETGMPGPQAPAEDGSQKAFFGKGSQMFGKKAFGSFRLLVVVSAIVAMMSVVGCCGSSCDTGCNSCDTCAKPACDTCNTCNTCDTCNTCAPCGGGDNWNYSHGGH
jgi:hypothetical protein